MFVSRATRGTSVRPIPTSVQATRARMEARALTGSTDTRARAQVLTPEITVKKRRNVSYIYDIEVVHVLVDLQLS